MYRCLMVKLYFNQFDNLKCICCGMNEYNKFDYSNENRSLS